MTEPKTRVHHIDCNHSWLQVPKSDLRALGLSEDALPYALTDGENLYLSEDEEMGVYLSAAEAAGWDVKPDKRRYPDRCDHVRSLTYLSGGEEMQLEQIFDRFFR